MDREPIAHGGLLIEGDLIKAVLEPEQLSHLSCLLNTGQFRSFTNAVIVPGLINLHSHLDYSALGCLPVGSSLFSWIKELVVRSQQWTQQEWMDSAFYGAEKAALSGTTFICDSSYTGAAAETLAAVGLRGIVALELFGIDEAHEERTWKQWKTRMAKLQETDNNNLKSAIQKGLLELTVSPHAPYTVCPSLWRRAQDWACEHNLPILAHLAESKQEYQWITSYNSELNAFLEFAFPDFSETLIKWRGNGLSPVEHLRTHDLLNDRLLAAHAIHLDDTDVNNLASHGVKVAHCPRSNSYIKAGLAKISKLVKSGIKMGLGTDSLASNQDLNMLNEASFAQELHNLMEDGFQADSKKMLEMITIEAAKAAGKEKLIGSLTAGKYADIAVFEPQGSEDLGNLNTIDPYDLIIKGHPSLKELIVGGKTIVSDGKLSFTLN